MQEELDLVIGSNRIISMDDKHNLHYTSAVINEIQRIANLIPINVLHTTSRNVNINGHHIRKGTMIIPQICAILYDEKVMR
uniref:Cytochrome P450 n=1 Tax=Acrobeloides nanus TaxID=290746 RepID=A0A914EF35_9BILA